MACWVREVSTYTPPGEFHSQELANTGWAFATWILVRVRRHFDFLLFTALVGAAVQWVSVLHTQKLAHTAWALAIGERPDEMLFAVLARAVAF